MATHSSVLAWRIPGTEEPLGLLSIRSHRVGHDLVTKSLSNLVQFVNRELPDVQAGFRKGRGTRDAS